MRFYFADQLHGPYLGCTAERTGRKGVDESLDGVGPLVQFSAYARNQVDDVAVILGLFVEFYFYVVAVAA